MIQSFIDNNELGNNGYVVDEKKLSKKFCLR